LDVDRGESPYTWYRESAVGNSDVHWEKVKKFGRMELEIYYEVLQNADQN
jgi:hypothetical protein